MQGDKIDEILQDLDKAAFGLGFAMIPDDKKAAYTKATSLGYLDIDAANNYCLSRIGQLIVNSGLSYREWEAQNSKPDGTGLLNGPDQLTAQEPATEIPEALAPPPAMEEKPAKKSWLSIFGLK